MKIKSILLEHLYEKIFFHKYYPVVLLALFFLVAAFYFLTWPIVGYDTDLWYHLSGGRYFWQNGAIARDAFFSYIQPAKDWYNYYWLFQVIVYKVFQWSGYYGPIFLRCLLYLATVFFIYLFFTKQRENRAELIGGLFLFASCALLILHRELLVRPHLFSYFFIVVFLYILEYKQEKIWLLPVLGILWANIHGIEYPVMFLIVFAYLAEYYYHQLRKTGRCPQLGKKDKWLLIAVFYTVFATPQIIRLIQIPFDVSFQNAAYQYLYVQELLKIPLSKFFIFAPFTVNGFINSLQNIVILLAAICFFVNLWKKQLRISHGLIFICALFLLTTHTRFTYEFTLLSLPLLQRGLRPLARNIPSPRRLAPVFLLVIVAVPVFVFSNVFSNIPAYPLAITNLPTGVVGFLNRQAPGGKILNETNTGGYLPWELKAQFKIFMDMQMAVFSDLDFATASKAFTDANVFQSFLRKYDPSFISVSLNRPYFKKIIAAKGDKFVPVFFDNVEALYVQKEHFKDLAARYELKTIDPFTYRDIKYQEQLPEQLDKIYLEALKMYAQDNANYGASHIICSILITRKKLDQASPYAENIIRHYPDLSHGYALKADVLFGQERYEEAAPLYEKALAMGQTASTDNVYRNLYATYVKLKEFKKAYNLFFQYVNPFHIGTDYKDIYQLGMSAATVGKIKEAVTFLQIAQMKVPPEDQEYSRKISESLKIFSADHK